MSKSWIVMSRKIAAGASDVIERWGAGIAGGNRHHLDLADPAGIDGGLDGHEIGSKRRLKPTMSVPLSAATVARQAFTRATTDRQAFRRTRLCPPSPPASIGRREYRSGCRSRWRQWRDRPEWRRSRRPRIRVRRQARGCSAGSASATAANSARLSPRIARACTLPIRPAPRGVRI